ncbi:MAG: O-antigen translocase [bacterium]|nr:O-antigen translocase [bacterium]
MNKIVAVVAGPSGMALIGQVQNVSTILQGVTSGLFSTAAVKYSAEWKDQPARLYSFLSLSYTLVFWLTVSVGSATMALSWWLAKFFLNDTEYWWVFALLGLTIPLFATNSLMLSVINGFGNVKRLTLLNVAQSILGLILSVGLPMKFGVSGALAATTLASSVVFVVLLPELRNQRWLRLRRIRLRVCSDDLKRLGGFALMSLTVAICAPLTQLIVRGQILERSSLLEAGYWQALNRFSGAYLVFFTTTLSVYYLPKFATQTNLESKAELKRSLGILWPVALTLLVGVWVFRKMLIKFLFSDDFLPISEIFHYQLLGDFLKLNSWLLGSLLLAKRAILWVIASEIMASAFFIICAAWLIDSGGKNAALGATKAYVCVYAFHLCLMLIAAWSVLRPKIVVK